MKNLTIVILAHNEESNLRKLLPTLDFSSEILILNDRSSDQSDLVAEKYKAKYLTHSLNENFAEARNLGLKEAKSDWVLFLDADERIDESFLEWIKALEPEGRVSAYRFCRHDWFWNKRLCYGEMGKVWVTRLVRKGCGKFVRPVHEVWETKLSVEPSPIIIHHYPHPTIREFLEHINLYSTINAKYWHSQKKLVGPLEILFWPLFKFIYLYFFRLGFLDSAPGFVYAFMMSFHSFLSRAKLYIINHQ